MLARCYKLAAGSLRVPNERAIALVDRSQEIIAVESSYVLPWDIAVRNVGWDEGFCTVPKSTFGPGYIPFGKVALFN